MNRGGQREIAKNIYKAAAENTPLAQEGDALGKARPSAATSGSFAHLIPPHTRQRESIIVRPSEETTTVKKSQVINRQLVEGLAHDIKNSLVAVNVYAQLLSSKFGTAVDDEQGGELAQGIQDNVKRVVRLVDAFLDSSALETGINVLDKKPLQLNHLIREVAQQHIKAVHADKLSLELDLDDRLPEINGDAFQLERVLWNLVGNAVKFTAAGGTIRLRSGFWNSKVCVKVEDTGAGMREEDLRFIFEEFRRLDTTSHVSGLGLGLYIVKTIVDAHEGMITVESKPAAGSTFTISFPVGL